MLFMLRLTISSSSSALLESKSIIWGLWLIMAEWGCNENTIKSRVYLSGSFIGEMQILPFSSYKQPNVI